MTKEQALDRLRARCSRAEYCCGQIVATLRRWKYEAAPSDGKTAAEQTEEDIAQIISTLVAERFVDDERFANAFVRDKLRFNGWGRQKIAYKLRTLGVASNIIEKALEENYYAVDDEDADDVGNDGGSGVYGGKDRLSGRAVLEKLLEKKWKSLKKEESLQNKRAKAIRFALSRGFDYEDAMKIVQQLGKNS